jgi:hypothetical protein
MELKMVHISSRPNQPQVAPVTGNDASQKVTQANATPELICNKNGLGSNFKLRILSFLV